MRTVVVSKQKGGCGATTLARELGVAAAASGQRVVFIDLDPQGTLRKWWNRRTETLEGDPNPALATPEPTGLAGALEELRAAKMDLCIIDTPPSIHAFLKGVVRVADLVLLPTRCTTDDLDALPDVLEQVEEAGRRFAFVLTQVPPGKSTLYDDTVQMLAQRGRVAPPLRFRAAFPVAAATGRTATEYAPKDKATGEVQDLWTFVANDLSKLARQRARALAS